MESDGKRSWRNVWPEEMVANSEWKEPAESTGYVVVCDGADGELVDA
jgi:hypothetical protein